jgi:hypothetical protein
MRWAAGSLDIARRQKDKTFTPAMADVLRKWLDPSLLALVQGTPINCLVVSWSSGTAADAEQQTSLKPLLDKARQAGLDVVGLIDGPGDKTAAVAAARAAGLSAIAMKGNPPANAGIPVIAWGSSDQSLWSADAPVLAISDASWPGVSQANDPAGGPTNLPWVDSNGALIGMAQAMGAGKGVKSVWVAVDPPTTVKQTAENFLLAIADAQASGGRWVISLDDQLRADLAAKTAASAATLKRITDMLAFFEKNNATRAYGPMARLAVVSNFSDPMDRILGEQSLNLLPRTREPFRVIARSQALAASLDGLQGIFYVDRELPDAALRQKLIAFAEAGGTLFVRANWSNPEGTPMQLSSEEAYLLFSERSVGKGRLAVARQDELDPFFTCADIQNILSHRGDPMRLYNGPSMNCVCQVATDGRQGVIHMLNYARRAGGDPAVVYVKTPYAKASFVSPEIASPVPLQLAVQAAGGAELTVPKFAVYGAVQLES